ncbi:hypothetical protein CEXT_783621 [Caerostris extrusa]|uniref:Uncharacterized protein n=1 Tax=Caerostris extrusa TaxID=172846 RepID=A0AAV4NVL8_CAEEX|nr:hypothetical protein CEXT_783621 [Caerostris extrusa]
MNLPWLTAQVSTIQASPLGLRSKGPQRSIPVISKSVRGNCIGGVVNAFAVNLLRHNTTLRHASGELSKFRSLPPTVLRQMLGVQPRDAMSLDLISLGCVSSIPS